MFFFLDEYEILNNFLFRFFLLPLLSFLLLLSASLFNYYIIKNINHKPLTLNYGFDQCSLNLRKKNKDKILGQLSRQQPSRANLSL